MCCGWYVFCCPLTFCPNNIIVLVPRKLSPNLRTVGAGEKQLYRHNNRPIQHLNGRTIYHHKDTSATKESGSGSNNDSEGGRSRRPRDE